MPKLVPRTDFMMATQPNGRVYFIDESAEITFYLMRLTGSERLDALGVRWNTYLDKQEALAWYNERARYVRGNTQVLAELNAIYEDLLKGPPSII